MRKECEDVSDDRELLQEEIRRAEDAVDDFLDDPEQQRKSVTPVEERIDHAEAKKIAERMERWSIVECAKLARAYLALLTEHSACEEREKEIKLGRALIDHLQGQVTWEKTEHDKARDEWLAMRDRLNSLHRAITGALEHTKPPESWVGNAADYEGDIEAEPYAWLATLVAEALADHPSFLDYDDAATAALPATEPAQPKGTDPSVEIVSWHDRRVYDCETRTYLGRAVGEPYSDGVEGLIALRQDEEGQTVKAKALCAFVVLDNPPEPAQPEEERR